MVGAGWSRFHWVENAEIDRLDKEVVQKKEQLQEHQEIANNYDNLADRYQTLKEKVNENAKLLVKAKNADQVYSALISFGKDRAFTYMNFISVDSTNYDNFGLLKFDVSGEGYYRNLNQFVNRIEYGRSLFKIKEMSIEPLTDLENLGRVNYSFKLESLYDRKSIFEDYSLEPTRELPVYTYNSFYPLIHDVKENEENLPDVEASKLLSVGKNFVSLRDQNGNIQYLYEGDRVYLGTLITVDRTSNSATFKLNEGGIIKYITRELD
ncbi:Pilus assembly protein, PilO [Fodinibius sediminis]|uniref:Pilus assembly protein, PilO n=2 Tax=Fodinibius sediminis TaxID=1214077 RepID=A0A521EPY0_9BACT|nr:Pilus assembly protein, PilO [Fodinibius sediminis]